MNCDCIEKANTLLGNEGLALKLHQTVNMTTYEVSQSLALETIALKRGAKKKKLFPAFCPFCGTRATKTAVNKKEKA